MLEAGTLVVWTYNNTGILQGSVVGSRKRGYIMRTLVQAGQATVDRCNWSITVTESSRCSYDLILVMKLKKTKEIDNISQMYHSISCLSW